MKEKIKKEISEKARDNMKIVFSEQQIHLDDTIGTIKIKILSELRSSLKKNVTFGEIYLFCKTCGVKFL